MNRHITNIICVDVKPLNMFQLRTSDWFGHNIDMSSVLSFYYIYHPFVVLYTLIFNVMSRTWMTVSVSSRLLFGFVKLWAIGLNDMIWYEVY